jgi:Lysozyme like domain
MNPNNIAALAAGAGFSGNDVDIAVAVALAESSGDPNAFNPEGSYGLWQIYVPDHPEFAGWNLLDPQTNAQAAYRVYAKAGGRFTPWSAFKNKAYLAFLPSQPARPAPPPPLVLDASTGLPIDESSVAAGFSPPSLPNSGPSFGKMLLWGAIGLFALWMFEEVV